MSAGKPAIVAAPPPAVATVTPVPDRLVLGRQGDVALAYKHGTRFAAIAPVCGFVHAHLLSGAGPFGGPHRYTVIQCAPGKQESHIG